MILFISCALLLIALVCSINDMDNVAIVLLTLGLYGLVVCGIVITVKKEKVIVAAKVHCSEEIGECRIKTEDYGDFTVTGYMEVNHLLKTYPDSVQLIKHLNSYGFSVGTKIKVL